MIRVVHIITGLETGGAETMLANLVTAMDRTRFRNEVISLTKAGELGPRVRAAGIAVHELGMMRGVPDPIALIRLVRLLRKATPAVVQTWLYHADLIGLLACRFAGAPRLIWNLRCSNMDLSRYRVGTRLVQRILARFSSCPDAVIVNSFTGKHWHEAIGYRPRRWVYIPNGFDLDRFRPRPKIGVAPAKSLGTSRTGPRIGLIARYDPMKDHETFLRAAEIISIDRSDAIFVMAGRGIGWDNAELSALIDSFGLTDRVCLLGERSDVAAILPGLDILSVTSAFGEGFPNVLGEAMACGVPCVSTNVGDAALIVGQAGEVVPVRQPETLAMAWRRILDLAPEGRSALAAMARRRVQANFELSKIIHIYENFYLELTKTKTCPQ